MHWFTIAWWKYVLAHVDTRYNDEWFYRWRVYFCRIRGHPYGVVFYNPNGYEPDMTCRNCGEDLG
jgi:hypothetical protein